MSTVAAAPASSCRTSATCSRLRLFTSLHACKRQGAANRWMSGKPIADAPLYRSALQRRRQTAANCGGGAAPRPPHLHCRYVFQLLDHRLNRGGSSSVGLLQARGRVREPLRAALAWPAMRRAPEGHDPIHTPSHDDQQGQRPIRKARAPRRHGGNRRPMHAGDPFHGSLARCCVMVAPDQLLAGGPGSAPGQRQRAAGGGAAAAERPAGLRNALGLALASPARQCLLAFSRQPSCSQGEHCRCRAPADSVCGPTYALSSDGRSSTRHAQAHPLKTLYIQCLMCVHCKAAPVAFICALRLPPARLGLRQATA